VSTTNRVVEVPRLRFAVRNASGNDIYSWIRTAQPQPFVTWRDLGVPVTAGLATARDARRAGAVLQPFATLASAPSEAQLARILIAEDEDALRGLVARALLQDGHDVMTANDGGEALDLLLRGAGRLRALAHRHPLPVMDGIALALAAARDHPNVTILLMTGYAEPARARDRSQHPDPRRRHQPFTLANHPGRGQRRARRRQLPQAGKYQ